MKKLRQGATKKKINDGYITYGVVALFAALAMVLDAAGVLPSLYSGLLVPVCVYSIAAVGLNLCVGYLGELSLGHGGFMCVGAFASACFTNLMKDTVSNELALFFGALLIGVLFAAVFGFFIGIPVLRLNGDYLAIVTLAFGEIVKNIINVLYLVKDGKGLHFAIITDKNMNVDAEEAKYIINGAKGISGTPHLSSFLIGVILLLLSLAVVQNLVDSRSGRAVKAIRDNRIAAESVGIPITKYKMLAFVISAAIAGAGGVLYAHNLSTLTATTNNFGYNMSILILVYVVLGGIGNIRGSVIAATILTILPEALRSLNDYRMLIYAVVLIGMMLFNWAPGAIAWRQKIFSKKTVKGEQ